MWGAIVWVVGAVASGLIGLYLTVKFEDRWKARTERRNRRRLSRLINHGRTDDTAPVSIAGRPTGVHLIEGDGEIVIAPSNITVDIRSPATEPPQLIARLRQREARRLSAAHRASDAPVTGWNSPHLVALDRYRTSRTPAGEDVVLRLETHATDYATFAVTVLGLDTAIPLTDGRGETTEGTLRQHYLPTPAAIAGAVRRPIPHLGNGLGVALLAFTHDGKVVLSRRKDSSRARPGQRDVTVVEGLHAAHDRSGAGRLDVTRAAIRGCKEEIGVTVEADDVRLLAFGVDLAYYQWNFLGVVDAKYSADQLLEFHALNARDRWEGKLEPYPADPEIVLRILHQDDAWDTALVTAYLAFCSRIGVPQTHRAAARAFGTIPARRFRSTRKPAPRTAG
jgi:hypothetical protein